MKNTNCIPIALTLALHTASLPAATITIDGVNDFPAVDTYVTSTAGQTGYVSIDAANLDLGSPTEIDLAAYMLSDQTGLEWSCGVVPSTAL